MANRNYKKPHQIKSGIKQYLIVAGICLPILIFVSLLCEIKWKLPQALTIFIMCCIILLAWLIWLVLKNYFAKRNKKFARERKEKLENKTR